MTASDYDHIAPLLQILAAHGFPTSDEASYARAWRACEGIKNYLESEERMKLSDIDLTTDQLRSLLDILDERTKARQEYAAEKDRIEGLSQRFSRHYDETQRLARETAQINGVVEGLPAGYAAEATWAAFIAYEGWYSPSDIGDTYEPSDLLKEAWVSEYERTIEGLKRATKG